jgi:DNA-binding LacI/PurR family transcriptional regulator
MGLERRASEAECTTMLCNTDGRPELEAARVERLLERTVSGIALLQFSGDGALLDELEAARVPVVVISCWEERTDCVAVDDRAGMALAVEHLHALGHRRIGFVSGGLIEAFTHRARYAGYEAAMYAHDLRPRPALSVELADLTGGPDAPSAFVVANDLLAVQVIDALEGAGLRVPEDVSVVGFDGIGLGAHSRIGLTSVAQPRGALVERGVDLLVERMRVLGADGARRHVRLAPSLVVRQSTAPPVRG